MAVTGGAGFIGSHLVAALVEIGATVLVADDLSNGDAASIAGLGPTVQLVRTSLGVEPLDFLAGVDACIHCAADAYVPPSVESPMEDFETNLRLTLRILEWIRTNSPQTAVALFSSGAVYGNPTRLPVPEDAPLDPISPYGVSKLASERYGAVYARLYSMPVAVIRSFAVYGPRQRKQVVYDVIRRMHEGRGDLTVLGDGGQVRDFCYVEDVARGVLTILERAPMEGEAWNLGGGEPVTIRELVGLVAEVLGLEACVKYSGSIRPGDAQSLVADCTRLRNLGWEPTTPLIEGLRQTAAWVASDTHRGYM